MPRTTRSCSRPRPQRGRTTRWSSSLTAGRATRDVASDATGRFVITRRELLVADRPDGLTRYPLHVATADWSRDFGSLVGVPFVRDEVGVIAVNPQPRLIAFDVPSGRTLWKKSLKEPPTAAPVVAGGKIWLGDKDGLAAYDLVTGEQLLKVDAGAVTGRLLAEGARIACTNGAGELLVADTSSGKELLRVDKIDGALPPMLAGDDVLYYNGKAILRRPVEGKASTEWLRRRDFSWMGKPTAPIIVVNANIYLATDRMGLMCIQPKKEP